MIAGDAGGGGDAATPAAATWGCLPANRPLVVLGRPTLAWSFPSSVCII